jgi:hypothetical protein
MNDRASAPDELRADFLELLWAYIEATKAGVLEWPHASVESQSTPIEAQHECSFLWEISAHAAALRNSLGERDGRAA